MQAHFKTGTRQFDLKDVYRYQEHFGTDSRWEERAFLFRDGSILWEMMGFTAYAENGSRFSTGGVIHRTGALNLSGRINGDYPIGINDFVAQIKRLGTHLQSSPDIWEMPSPD
jgi:hypothetical protein